MFMNFHAHPLHILWVIYIFALHRFFFPLVYMYYSVENKSLGIEQTKITANKNKSVRTEVNEAATEDWAVCAISWNFWMNLAEVNSNWHCVLLSALKQINNNSAQLPHTIFDYVLSINNQM